MKKLLLITIVMLSASPSFAAWTIEDFNKCEAQGGTFVINGPNPGCRLP